MGVSVSLIGGLKHKIQCTFDSHDVVNVLTEAKHPELCALCDNPERCSYNNHLGSHEAALSCLTDRGGDVAYVALQYAKDYFGVSQRFAQALSLGRTLVDGGVALQLGDRKERARPDEYRYLCPNGTMQTIKTNAKPCTWLRQPWNVLMAKKYVNIST